MKYHYIPKYDESEFNRIAEDTDPVLLEKRKRKVSTDIVHKRNAILRLLSDLRYKPRQTLEDEQRMRCLEDEAKKLMLQIGALNRLNNKR